MVNTVLLLGTVVASRDVAHDIVGVVAPTFLEGWCLRGTSAITDSDFF